MDSTVATSIADKLKRYGCHPDPKYRLAEHIKGELSAFHQWADNRPSKGAFLFKPDNEVGSGLWLVDLQWQYLKGNSDFYLVLFPEARNGPLAEIHQTVGPSGEEVLQWRYIPRKGDKQNEKRKAYFAQAYLTDADNPTIQIAIPQRLSDVGDFLDELFFLVDCRIKADELDGLEGGMPPITRPGFPEGKVKERLHYSRERNQQLIRQAKQAALEKGKLKCQCCNFDFEAIYGEHGKGFIEAHHTIPVSELHEAGGETKIEDLALVCSNCHRMLHRRRPWLSMENLEQLIVTKS